MEEWRSVPDYEGPVFVSSWGRVRTPRGLSFGSESRAYRVVNLKGHTHAVHRLVCLAFHGKARPGQAHVRHLNGIGSDNRAENLAWGTASENAADKRAHGTNDRLNRTHCPWGHEHTDFNRTAASRRIGRRGCKACHQARSWATVRGLSPRSPEARNRADQVFDKLRKDQP